MCASSGGRYPTLCLRPMCHEQRAASHCQRTFASGKHHIVRTRRRGIRFSTDSPPRRSSAVSRNGGSLRCTDFHVQCRQLVSNEPECVATEQKMRGRMIRCDGGQHCARRFPGISQLLTASFLAGLTDGIENIVVIRNRAGGRVIERPPTQCEMSPAPRPSRQYRRA